MKPEMENDAPFKDDESYSSNTEPANYLNVFSVRTMVRVLQPSYTKRERMIKKSRYTNRQVPEGSRSRSKGELRLP